MQAAHEHSSERPPCLLPPAKFCWTTAESAATLPSRLGIQIPTFIDMDSYSTIRLLALVSSGLVAGAMAAHTVVLGTILTWLLHERRPQELHTLLDGYRKRYLARIIAYWVLFGFHFLAISVFAVAASLAGRGGSQAIAAAVIGAPLWVGIHLATFGRLEAKAMATPEALTEPERARFVRFNGVLHVFYALCLCASFVLVALTPA